MDSISPIDSFLTYDLNFRLGSAVSVMLFPGVVSWRDINLNDSFCASSPPSSSGDMFTTRYIDFPDRLLPPGVTSSTRTGSLVAASPTRSSDSTRNTDL